MDADLEILAEDGDVFTKIEMVAEIVDGSLTLKKFRHRRRGEEPGGKGVFAHAGAGEGEEFEETAGTEEVEVGGVEAGVKVDALAGLTGAYPAIFDACETVAVKVDRSFGAGALSQNIGVEDCNCEEQGESEEEPPC